jgi:hypothetical protein
MRGSSWTSWICRKIAIPETLFVSGGIYLSSIEGDGIFFPQKDVTKKIIINAERQRFFYISRGHTMWQPQHPG